MTVPSDRSIFPRLQAESQPQIHPPPSELVLRGGLSSQLPTDIISASAAASHPHVPRIRTLQAKMVSYLTSLCSLQDTAAAPSMKASKAKAKAKGKKKADEDMDEEDDNDDDEALARSYSGKVRFGSQANDTVERLCANIFGRIADLRGHPNDEGEMEEVPRPAKHRAMVDLKELKSEGGPSIATICPMSSRTLYASKPSPLP